MKNFFKNRKLKKDIRRIEKTIKSTLNNDDDILPSKTVDELKLLLAKVRRLKIETFDKAKAECRVIFDRYLKILPKKKYKILREYVEIVIVAITVAFGARALYVQPFKIPTGSMQPTLYGIHYIDKSVIPDVFQPLNYLLYSTFRAKLVVEEEGQLMGVYPPYNRYLVFPWTDLLLGQVKYSLPGTPQKVAEYCFGKYLQVPSSFPVGYTICNGWLSEGDHLFVNRLIYHFLEPKRGDIVVFTTVGLYNDSNGEPLSEVGYYYVKRLVGMPGDTLKIVKNMLLVKPKGAKEFKPITNFGIKCFNKIYSNKGGYVGYTAVGRLAPNLEVIVPEDHYFMLGDNTLWSADSRYWGFVPRENIVGKATFVFWPFTRRWGLADTKPPIDYQTTVGPNAYIKAMTLQ